MHVIGLIAEYNPFHNGHLYQIKMIKNLYPDSIIVSVISSSFTQRGDVSILNKWDKTKIALNYGIDIVLELPFVYATQSADIFAKGAIAILKELKIDTLVFGTESISIDKITKVAKFQLENKKYNEVLKRYLKNGMNYPTATNKAIENLIGIRIDKPNDLLALAYIREVFVQKMKISIRNIPRTNDYHSTKVKGKIASATAIRKSFLENASINKLIPYKEEYLDKLKINN